ncbi:MAG: hybrid sensor histidine kinase/response regulator [Candidatus Latescibacteria bacterium]|jgi:two-component system, sensor histidine kinase and response regulator|nr:hybrid sensor histidine kinase/response regulator [Candidatus Latescibacterota bacterium]MBT4140759.1 hybrid sensor histidine kinase/response regulator [Candidatus Latescibacterota bacterium]
MNLSPQNQRILIVDDTVKNLQVLGTILENEGYQINVAQNGTQALEITSKVQPDLVLLDVMMPDLDGFEVCQRLKADASVAHIPIIFLTARTETADLVKGFAQGAVDYVTKPFNATELLVRVRTHLSIHYLQSALRKSLDDNARMQREHEAFLRHELKNRITPIMGYSDALQHTELDEMQTRWVTTICNSTQDMSELIDILKDLQDIEAGTMVLSKNALPLNDLLENVVVDVQTSFEHSTIQLNLPTDTLSIDADGNLLRGGFHNLIKNAVEHVAGLEDVGDRLVQVTLTDTPVGATITIHNHGVPIPEDLLDVFFEKFNTHEKQGGTGLGTTYAFLVTQAHGGEIGVVSTETDGTMITVALPK